ncbi:MAG: hypothetical protein AB8V03_06150 [Francisella endosymbiont of Hyalomma asiaticum]
MIFQPIQLFKNHPDTQKLWVDKFKYILNR